MPPVAPGALAPSAPAPAAVPAAPAQPASAAAPAAEETGAVRITCSCFLFESRMRAGEFSDDEAEPAAKAARTDAPVSAVPAGAAPPPPASVPPEEKKSEAAEDSPLNSDDDDDDDVDPSSADTVFCLYEKVPASEASSRLPPQPSARLVNR